jgi:hypothetical protein
MKCSNCGNNKNFLIKETSFYTAESSENKLEILSLVDINTEICCTVCGEPFNNETPDIGRREVL